jgi:hypothetical protein
MVNFVTFDHCKFSIVPAAWARVLNGAVTLGAFVGLGMWARAGGPLRKLAAFLGLLATIPVISPLGWAYVYVLAVPALLLLLQCALKSTSAYVLLIGACLSYFVPATHELRPVLHLPEALQQLVYDRYLFTTLLVVTLLVVTRWVRLPREAELREPLSTGRDDAGRRLGLISSLP